MRRWHVLGNLTAKTSYAGFRRYARAHATRSCASLDAKSPRDAVRRPGTWPTWKVDGMNSIQLETPAKQAERRAQDVEAMKLTASLAQYGGVGQTSLTHHAVVALYDGPVKRMIEQARREGAAYALAKAAHDAAFGDEFFGETYAGHVEAWLDELAAGYAEGEA